MDMDPEQFRHEPDYTPCSDIEDIYRRWDNVVPADEFVQIVPMVRFLAEQAPTDQRTLSKATILVRRRFPLNGGRKQAKKAHYLHVLNTLVARGELEPQPVLKALLVKKSAKSTSGVLVVTVMTSPFPHGQKFSCEWDCHFCPAEPGQPRSYLHDEPSVLRGNHNGWDPVLQFTDRASVLAMNGHPVDKIELLVLGGTWESYPLAYREEFVRDLFYAANTFYEREKRPRESMEEEQLRNESAVVKIIGLTLETRPDTIDVAQIRRLRRYGCTRVQLGIQHVDDGILKRINRGHTIADAKAAIRLLKDSCYKIDIHLMPNLPGSSPETDLAMFREVLDDPDLQCDQWKIYPCEVLPWTALKRWHDQGKFTPYPDDDLIAMLMDAKALVHPYIRLNRVIRDIPSQYILGGIDNPSLRQVLQRRMIERGTPCRCIRCREVGSRDVDIDSARLMVRSYPASGGTEHFISFETPDESVIFGFLRLRLSPGAGADGAFPELEGAALIRELHVYGQLIATSDREGSHAQHAGFGRRMMAWAEQLARQEGLLKIAVIAGIGTRNYYRRLGYRLHEEGPGGFLIKELEPVSGVWALLPVLAAILLPVLLALACAYLGLLQAP